MNTLVEFIKNFLLSPVGTFSTIASVLSIAAWLIVIATRKVTRLELSQKQLETDHKEVVKKIDQLSADMRDGFQRMEDRFEKVDEKFDRKIESLSEKLDRNTEELRKDIANLRTDVRILQHDNHNAKSPASRTKSFRQGNRRRVAAGF